MERVSPLPFSAHRVRRISLYLLARFPFLMPDQLEIWPELTAPEPEKPLENFKGIEPIPKPPEPILDLTLFLAGAPRSHHLRE